MNDDRVGQLGLSPNDPIEAPLEYVLDAYAEHIKSVTVTYGCRGSERWVTSKVELYEGAFPQPD